MSVAADLVTPSWLQLPKWDKATVSGQRSAAQNGHDSSLTNSMTGLPPARSGGPEAGTEGHGAGTRPRFTWVRRLDGTVVTCLTTATGAADSLAVRWAGVLFRLTVTSVAAMATTAVTDPSAISIRRRRPPGGAGGPAATRPGRRPSARGRSAAGRAAGAARTWRTSCFARLSL